MIGGSLGSARITSELQAHLDSPRREQKVYDQTIVVSGWLYAPHQNPAECTVRAEIDGFCFAESRILFYRPEINERLRLPRDLHTGFRLLGRILPTIAEPRDVTLRIVASWAGKLPTIVAEQPVRLVPSSLGQRPYGEVVYPDNETLLHRENIYGSGPPIEEPGVEVANLLREYLPPGCSVVDVGCGAGAYGPGLMAAGHDWLGLEANLHCCSILQRRNLPFRKVDLESQRLPCSDAEWDCAVCIEVLEHIKEPEIFLREIARTIRRRALFSVPNMEVIPYLHDWGVVPWHLLEGDHKNFFTRGSLRSLLGKWFPRVEIFSYGEHPLKTREDIPVHVHFFAIADAP
jgi:SAM-dependent methyltransferase